MIVLLSIIFFLIFPYYTIAASDPFSKIMVKSERAIFQKEKQKKSSYHATYKGNVFVTFSDLTTVSADELDILIEAENMQDATKKASADIKKVLFTNNVCIKRSNRTIWAHEVELCMLDKICWLRGDVKIKQIKQDEKDIPVETTSQTASFNWETEEISLIGNEKKPVSTIIDLVDYSAMLKKKREEKSEKRKKTS